MSNQNDIVTLQHTLKDVERQLKKNFNQMNWILILTIASLAISLISFFAIIAQ